MPPISAVIIAQDEEARIADAVLSIRPWVGEVVVIDGGSRDRTVEVARGAGARVIARPFDGFASQARWGATVARYDLVFALDADERVDPELGAAIARSAERGGGPVAWRVRRRNYLDGVALRHTGWYPDWRIRLFDRRHSCWAGAEPHHRVETRGAIGELPGHIHHDPERTTASFVASTEAHARRRARSLVDVGVRPWPATPLLRGLGHLARKLLLAGAFLDGCRGWTVAVVGARGVVQKYSLARTLAGGPR